MRGLGRDGVGWWWWGGVGVGLEVGAGAGSMGSGVHRVGSSKRDLWVFLFDALDTDVSGTIEISEFFRLIDAIAVGLSHSRPPALSHSREHFRYP